jgi:hypothetical protein
MAIRAWKPSKEFAWLDKEMYVRKIQPRLTSVSVPAPLRRLRRTQEQDYLPTVPSAL